MQCDGGQQECNVRVVVRVRPLVARERIAGSTESLHIIPGSAQIVVDSEHSYSFDEIFGTTVKQNEIFDQAVLPMLGAFLEGYNCTILAYGQTGSGKTFTMGTGMDASEESAAGIIPRAVNTILAGLPPPDDPDRCCEMFVSFLEIYNEEIIDLLNPSQQEDSKTRRNILAIREDTKGEISIAGIREEKVTNQGDIFGCLEKGSLCRTTKSTQMNLVSSRSHAIFTLTLRQKTKKLSADGSQEIWQSKLSKLHFVDLAGSERLKRTQASGQRAKESISINGGLLALGNVISALGDESKRAVHVPYRDSKLTRMLQDSLGGNSRTLMIACVSPSSDNLNETLNTLKYAHRARNIKNKVSIGDAGSAGDAGFEILQLKKLVASLRQQLQQIRTAPGRVNNTCTSSDTGKLRQENADLLRLVDRLKREKLAVEAERDSLRLAIGGDRDVLKQLTKPTRRPLTGSLREKLPPVQISEMTPPVEPATPAWFQSVDSVLNRVRSDIEQSRKIIESNQNTVMDIDNEDPIALRQLSREATKNELAIVSMKSDLSIKEDLIQQIETSKQEYLYMRDRFEERVRLLQSNLRIAETQRDQALQNVANNVSINSAGLLRDETLSRAGRQKYEDRIKKLGKEIIDLKEKLRLANHSSSTKNQASECLLRNLKSNLSSLKSENVRLSAQLSEELSRLRTTSSVTEADLREAKARERKALEQATKWHKAHDFQRALLKKRIEQVIQSRAKIRQLVALLRRHRVDLSSPSAGIDFQSPGWKALQADCQSPLIPQRLLGRKDIPLDPVEARSQSPIKKFNYPATSQLGKTSVSAHELDDDLLVEATSQMALESSSPFTDSAAPNPNAISPLEPSSAFPITSSIMSSTLLPKSILRASPLLPRRRDFFARIADATSGAGTAGELGSPGPATNFSFPETPSKPNTQRSRLSDP